MAGKQQEPRWRSFLGNLGRSGKSPSSGAGRRTSGRRGSGFSLPPILEQLRAQPDRLRGAAENLPPWAGEVAAILLIVFGIVSLLALLNVSSEATVTSIWADAIRQLFGLGAFVVALGFLAMGVIIVLPRLGIVVHFPWQRVLAIEMAFISLLALLHLLANDPEPRALARAGGGGGYVGWALSQFVAGLLDPITSTILYSIVFIISVSAAVGLRRDHIELALDWISGRLHRLDEALEGRANGLENLPPPASKVKKNELSHVVEPQGLRGRPSIVPRPAPEPHVRPLAGAQPKQPDSGDNSSPSPVSAQPMLSGLPGERPSIVPRSVVPENYHPASPAPRARGPKNPKIEYDEKGHPIRFKADELQEAKRIGKRATSLPPYELLEENTLNRPTDEEINDNARIIEATLQEFDLDVDVVDVRIGPVVTQYAVQPFKEVVNDQGEMVLQRVRVSKIASLERDLALALSAKRLRIQAPVPGHSYVGVEVPNRAPSVVSLRGVMESATFYRKRSTLLIPLGRDVSGASYVADLATMPHLLIAGTTGSGKSVCLTSITIALVMNNTPDKLKLVLLDPKMVELTRFNGLPHLLGPVETDQERIVGVLRWATREMDRRYKLLEVEAARNIETYNRALGRRRQSEHLPYIAIIFDEIGDLMLSRPDETEKTLTRLAQMARAVGIHLIVATQRPSVDVITGLIKANFPARASFAVASGVDSRVILDSVGAETLMGRGDMLFLAPDAPEPVRVQGCYVSDEEIERVMEYWSTWTQEQAEAGKIDPAPIGPWERGVTRREFLSETDPMLEEAIKLVIEAGEASASLLQRKLGVGYPRAARLVDLMQELGVVGTPQAGGRTREVLFKPGEDPFKKIVEKRLRGGE